MSVEQPWVGVDADRAAAQQQYRQLLVTFSPPTYALRCDQPHEASIISIA
jgi:hypothetical protein